MMTREDYAKMVEGVTCRWCGYALPTEIQNYNHGGGWELEGYTRRQWLYVECRRCDYQWSLAKLGIPRNVGETIQASSDAEGARHDL